MFCTKPRMKECYLTDLYLRCQTVVQSLTPLTPSDGPALRRGTMSFSVARLIATGRFHELIPARSGAPSMHEIDTTVTATARLTFCTSKAVTPILSVPTT